jgi:hypothetical protein
MECPVDFSVIVDLGRTVCKAMDPKKNQGHPDFQNGNTKLSSRSCAFEEDFRVRFIGSMSLSRYDLQGKQKTVKDCYECVTPKRRSLSRSPEHCCRTVDDIPVR